LGVTIAFLPQWKQRQNTQQPTPVFASNNVNRGSHYAHSFNGVVHQVMKNGQPLQLVRDTSGVVGATLHRWKNQADAQGFPPSTGDSPVSGNTDEDKEKP
jgi:hypothetical protein